VERLTCHCAHRKLDVDQGRRTRKIPAPLLRALHHRDAKTCRFPGCTHTRWLHAHHVDFWGQLGPTDLHNLVLLCSFHHRQVHEGGFRLTFDGTRVEVRDPRGRLVPDAPPLPPPGPPPAEAPGDARALEPGLMTFEPVQYDQVIQRLMT
jgi:hypothetical protein